ncbi:MAG: hypothetical protein LC749_03010, partial [Actinobacteria bacterium]|nr:hypothetical protein [Actinomycetota bacterium]
LRLWAERLTGAVREHEVPDYDPDLIAKARRYSEIPLEGALWSFRWAAREWVEALDAALLSDVILEHQTRGAQKASDVARNNGHDVHHHLHDIDRILSVTGEHGIDAV